MLLFCSFRTEGIIVFGVIKLKNQCLLVSFEISRVEVGNNQAFQIKCRICSQLNSGSRMQVTPSFFAPFSVISLSCDLNESVQIVLLAAEKTTLNGVAGGLEVRVLVKLHRMSVGFAAG